MRVSSRLSVAVCWSVLASFVPQISKGLADTERVGQDAIGSNEPGGRRLHRIPQIKEVQNGQGKLGQ
jgi:hypothetical protein